VILGLFFIFAGVMHFIIPGWYAKIVPWGFPALATVLISGVLEIAGGVGLLVRRTRKVAALCLALLLIALWPANFQMLYDAHARGASALYQALLVLRLPLQLPLINWTWRIYKSSGSNVQKD
jgi:uncharacterized membrane protein